MRLTKRKLIVLTIALQTFVMLFATHGRQVIVAVKQVCYVPKLTGIAGARRHKRHAVHRTAAKMIDKMLEKNTSDNNSPPKNLPAPKTDTSEASKND